MVIFWSIFVFIYGLILGSFTNVLIYRIPKNKSISIPPSACTTCGAHIKKYDNIPVLSWIILRGRCRECNTKISIQYPLVEFCTGLILLLMYFNFGLSLELLFASIVTVILIAISAIDYRTLIIPNGLVLALFVTGVLYSVARLLFPDLFAFTMTIWEPVIGFLAASLPLYLIAIITKGGMGGGDIKLMAAAGIFLGWKYVLLAMILGSLIGAVVSMTLIMLKIKKRKDMIPFGPFLCIGIFIALNYGPQIINWYTGLYTISS